MANVLHLYAQEYWHNDAHIIGTRDALITLRDVINVALKNHERESHCSVFAADGEGYRVMVGVATEQSMDTLQLPYTDTDATGEPRGVHPQNWFGSKPEEKGHENTGADKTRSWKSGGNAHQTGGEGT